jgi:hypothetical protein
MQEVGRTFLRCYRKVIKDFERDLTIWSEIYESALKNPTFPLIYEGAEGSCGDATGGANEGGD